MNKYFKKLIIMFVMVLGITGGYSINAFASDDFEIGTSNFNNTTDNSAILGDKLEHPEMGWKRYDDSPATYLKYISGLFDHRIDSKYYKREYHASTSTSAKYSFYFYGTKFRIITNDLSGSANNIQVSIDNNIIDSYSMINNYSIDEDYTQRLMYEKLGLAKGFHRVVISGENMDKNNGLYADAIDIDDDGYMLIGNENILSISEEKIKIKVAEDYLLNIVTNKNNIIWTSSDESIATVDQTGKVTGVKEGTCIITALIEGTDIKDTCEVTVTKEDVPVEPTGDGSLYIEMVDGNIKQAQDLDVADFIKWFKDRDLDDTENPIYKIKNAKGNTEYLVHDKIVAFEVR